MDQRFLVLALVVVPVLCVCLGVTVHFVVQPMVRTLVDAITELNRVLARPATRWESGDVRAELDELRVEVARLKAVQDFDRALVGEPDGGAASG